MQGKKNSVGWSLFYLTVEALTRIVTVVCGLQCHPAISKCYRLHEWLPVVVLIYRTMLHVLSFRFLPCTRIAMVYCARAAACRLPRCLRAARAGGRAALRAASGLGLAVPVKVKSVSALPPRGARSRAAPRAAVRGSKLLVRNRRSRRPARSSKDRAKNEKSNFADGK